MSLTCKSRSEKSCGFQKSTTRWTMVDPYSVAEITMGKYQEQLLSLEDKLESEAVRQADIKTLHDGYEYTTSQQYDSEPYFRLMKLIAKNGGLARLRKICVRI